MKLNEAEFEKLTGHAPEIDDLDRVNCPQIGKPGHLSCGLCPTCGQPAWTCVHFQETVAERLHS